MLNQSSDRLAPDSTLEKMSGSASANPSRAGDGKRSVTQTAALMWLTTLSLTQGIAAADEKAEAVRRPSAWGMLGTHNACVIFREYRKTKIGFFVVVVTAKTHGELEVVETSDGYAMDQKKYVEDEATMAQLQHRAIKDGLRYVKLQDKYSPEELQAARALCKQDVVSE